MSTSDKSGRDAIILTFPLARTRPKKAEDSYRDLGLTPLAERLGLNKDRLHGHWCSCCHGIWFGYAAEVECPVCGNRRG
jgi:rubrerythrin